MLVTNEAKKKNKIMIVDDDPDICEVFKDNGFTADPFSDPFLALNSFEAGLYDLLLLDIKMPEIHGFQLYYEMKKKDVRVKTCFLTAADLRYRLFSNDKAFGALHKELFLQKPIENTKLISEIRKLL